MSYWGVFGGFNVIGPQPLYWFYDLLVLTGLAGWTAWLVRRWGKWRSPAAERLLVLAAWVLVVLVALIRWTSQTYASQGRLAFPALGAIAVLVAFGLAGWLPRRWERRGLAAVSVLLFLLAAAIPFVVIRPAYARPPILTEGDVPADAQRSDVTHAGSLRLLAYELPQESVRPGQTLPVTIYWQLTEPDRWRSRRFCPSVGARRGAGRTGGFLSRPGRLPFEAAQAG